MENTNDKEYVRIYEPDSGAERKRMRPESFRKSRFRNIT